MLLIYFSFSHQFSSRTRCCELSMRKPLCVYLSTDFFLRKSLLFSVGRKKLNLGKIYLNRYMRYTPSVAVLLLFILSFIPYALVNGPSIRFLNTNVEACQEYWWSTLLLIQNYVNGDRMVVTWL
jgi:hypothetical protein